MADGLRQLAVVSLGVAHFKVVYIRRTPPCHHATHFSITYLFHGPVS
jgi:hypothetical protein